MKHIFAHKFVPTNIISACSCWSGLSCRTGWRSSRWTHSHWISDKSEMPHDKGLFWGRCTAKQAGFHCTCLIFRQLICLADGLMTKECWHENLGMLSCLEAGGFLEPSTFGWPTKRVLPEPLLHESWCLWVCPTSGAFQQPHISTSLVKLLQQHFHVCLPPQGSGFRWFCNVV